MIVRELSKGVPWWESSGEEIRKLRLQQLNSEAQIKLECSHVGVICWLIMNPREDEAVRERNTV